VKSKHQSRLSVYQMSSSSSSSSSTSYTYGFPGSQVTISLNKSGNHTLTLLRGPNTNSKTSSSVPVPVSDRKFPDGWVGPANTPFCKVCYDAGLPVADYTDHYVKDQPGPGGKVVCPTLLAQKCLKCGVAGHTSSYCPEEARLERERKEREREAKRMNASDVKAWKVVGGAGSISKLSAPAAVPVAPPAAVPVVPACRGSFGILAVDEPSDDSEYEREQEEVRNTPAGVPKPVVKERPVLTGPPPAVAPPKELTWAQRAAAAATKVPSSTPSSSSAPVQKSLTDTRFQLHHALCHNIGVTQRGSFAKKANSAAAAPANHRENAAAVAREGSLKRKQDSVTIPA
jgi:hypothetical protein